MGLGALQGQDRAVAALTRALESGHLAHAWLFQGPEGVGKEAAAVAFAQALTCAEKKGVGCGTCGSCRRVEQGNHPDVTRVLPEEEQVARGLAGRSDFDRTPSRDIRVEQVRALQERLSLRPLEAAWKVAILSPAHAMSVQAQNALLKTLEEPPRATVLLLVSSAPDRLLPTIRSRCTRAQFGPLPDEVVAQALHARRQVPLPQARALARLAGGSLGRALDLDAAADARRKDVITRFEALEPSDARGWLQLAETLASDRGTAEEGLDVLGVWLHDVAAARAGAGAAVLVNSDLEPLARVAAARVSAESLARRQRALDEARNAISARNGAARLQLERMFIEMFGAPGA